MALTTVTIPTYPDVPQMAGVPPVLVNPAVSDAEAVASVALVNAAELYLQQSIASQWGVFDANGNQLFPNAHPMELSPVRDVSIVTAPQENGAFTSYNRVYAPKQAKYQLVCDGSLQSYTPQFGIPQDATSVRAQFVSQVDALIESDEIYSLSSPELTFTNMNATHYDFVRKNATIIYVDIWFQEVRLQASEQFTQTATPAGQPTTHVGKVQLTSV